MSSTALPTCLKAGNYHIDLERGVVFKGDEQIKIRPKTFEMLALLLSSPGELVSKQTFLDKVWDDVTVDEQVLFQSIKELRKAFCELDAIKTFPRKGYAWIEPLEAVSTQECASKSVNRFNFEQLFSVSSSRISAFAAGLVLVLVSIGVWTSNQIQAEQVQDGAILILPVSSRFSGNEHQWLRFGAMDQVIQRLAPSVSKSVYQVEDILQVYARAGLDPDSDNTEQQIESLFRASGASLIAQLSLAGVPGDYQLIYKLHTGSSIENGILFSDFAASAFDQVAQKIAEFEGRSLAQVQSDHQSDFSNSMLAMAIEQFNQKNFETAANYLRIIVDDNPDNLIAKRHLAWSLSQLGQYQLANTIIEDIIQRIQNNATFGDLQRNKELGRIRFVQAQNYVLNKNLTEAYHTLLIAEANASSAIDLLYQGTISELMGQLYFKNKEFDSAKGRFQQAANYYEALQCPFGQASMQLWLAEVASEQGLYQQAVDHGEQAVNIASTSNLKNILTESQASLIEFEAKLTTAIN